MMVTPRAAFEAGAVLVAVVIGATYAAWELLGGGQAGIREVGSNIATPALSVTAAALAWRAAAAWSHDPAVASAWRRMALAIAAMAVGDVIWAVGQSVLGIEPQVGWHDVPYLVSYPLLLRALLSFAPRPPSPVERARFWLDSLTVLVGGGMLVWYFIIFPVASHTDTDPLARAVALAYIVGDLVLFLGVATVLLGRPAAVLRVPVRLVVIGLLFQLAGDLALARAGLQQEYVTGGITDAFWVLSYACLAMAAFAQVRQLRLVHRDVPAAGVLPASLSRGLPYAAVAAGYGLLLAVGAQQDSPAVTGLIVGAVVLTGLILARNIIGLRDNRRLAAQVAQQRVEARFRTLVQNSSDVLTIVDAHGIVTWQSPSGERVLGQAANAVVGQPFVRSAHGEDVTRVATFLAHAVHGEPTGPMEWRAPDEGGGWLHLESTASNLLADPTVEGIVVNTRDITERKDLEAKLGHALKMEAVGRLAGGVAHDFNNLLTAIVGHTALAVEQSPAPSLREHLDEIERAARRASALTTQLLAFSRRQVLQPSLVHPNAVIRDMQHTVRRLVHDDVAIDVVLDPAVCHVRMDPAQLGQILLNLCGNAGDAMPGGGTLRISTAPAVAEDGQRQVQLEVTDTGVGMDESTRARLFEPFFTTKAPGEGTGLGLATVYGITQQCGGTVDVSSVTGVGSTFRVRLPCAGDGPDPGDVADRAAPGRGTETVLLAEDEPAVRHLASRTLRRHGYTVLEARDGEHALDVAASHDGVIDLLLTDVVMPRLGGPALARRLLADRPDTQVLFMSGHTDDDVVLHGVSRGETRFIQKPFTPRDLATRVREVLDAVGRNAG